MLVLPDARETSARRYGRSPRKGAQTGSRLEERAKPKPQGGVFAPWLLVAVRIPVRDLHAERPW